MRCIIVAERGGKRLPDEHVIETLGLTRIVIRNGRIEEVGIPRLHTCPLARRFSRPVFRIDPAEVRESVEMRIREIGMCTPTRQLLSSKDFVTFGASELICAGLRSGLVDAGVIACDGAGTVIADTPELVQGIGGRMSGLIRTTPIAEVIGNIEKYGGRVCFPATAGIDQAGGVQLAREMGYHRIAATVTEAMTAEAIKKFDPEAIVIGVHLTGITEEGAERLMKVADIVSACASRWIREYAGRYARLQAGEAVPVFALTGRGKELILQRLRETGATLLVKATMLPVIGKEIPEPLV